jgi:quercetin dioxygenase-like cupin family protein
MRITRVDSVPSRPNPHGVTARLLHEGSHAFVMHLTLEPGQVIAPHAAPVDVLFYILEGSGEAHQGEESVAVSADTIIESPKGTAHGFSNTGAGLMRVLAVKLTGSG